MVVFFVLVAGLWFADLVSRGQAAFCPKTYLSAQTLTGSWVQAGPMTARGPRPLLVFDVNQPANWAEDLLQDAGDIMADQTDVIEELEPGWVARDKAQIVVCQYRDNVDSRARASCKGLSMGNIQVPVLSADYRFKVYEAQTEKLLGTFELPGAANDRTCPWMIGSPGSGPTVLIAKPGAREIVGKLRSFVEPSG